MIIRKGSQLRSNILMSLARGELKVGDRLPTECELIKQHGISRTSVREAMASLVEEGILLRRPGAGTFVAHLSATPQSSKIIAAMIPCVRNVEDVFSHLIRSIEDELHERGYSMILCNHDQDFGKINRYVARFCQEQVAGVIYVPVLLPGCTENNITAVREFERSGIPFVLLDSAISSETVSQYTVVASNGFSGTRDLVRHLVHLGHSRIAYINGLSGVFSAGQRFLGFIEEMRSQKMTVPDSYIRQIQIGPIVSQGRQEVRDLLALKPSPSAVLCSHDFLARNAMEEATKMGVRIPEDLAVVGFDDNPLAAHLDPPLTTVRQPVEAEGRLAVQLLLDKIDRKLLGERQEFLLCKLVIRRSCGSPYQPVEQEKRGIESCALTH